MTKDEALALALTALHTKGEHHPRVYEAMDAIQTVLEQPVQEPVSMRMPKVGDKVICLEDESLGEVVSLTAGGSPDILFDDGSHGTYLLREFAELFGYAEQRQWVGLTDEEIETTLLQLWCDINIMKFMICDRPQQETVVFILSRAIEAKLKEKNT